MPASWLQVNTALSDLANAANDNRRRQVLNRIRSECSPMNQKWIVRVSGATRDTVDLEGSSTTHCRVSVQRHWLSISKYA